jgi:uncharacterized protein (DUF302 family)
MTYHYSRTVELTFDRAVEATRESLGTEGFGVLSDIDVAATLKAKLDADFRPYRILGACNPDMAYRALRTEDKIGTMLPCNVIVQQREDGKVEISAVDPVESMRAVDNPGLLDIAQHVRGSLRAAIDRIAA